MTSTRKSLSYVEAMDIRAMVRDTIRSGKDIDRCVDGSNTLLHLSIQNNLVDCVVKLLSSGADANLLNEDGFTARDLALENGNQILLQVLSRREEYTVHLRLFDRSTDISSSTSGMDSFNILASLDPDIIATDAKMVPLLIGTIYEDYMDWTDSQRCNHLQYLVDTLRSEEMDLKRRIEGLNTRRICNNNKLEELHCQLRDREHALCLDVWSTIQAERLSRRQLERSSSEVVKVKALLTNALDHIHYKGIVRVAPYKRVFFNSWHHNTVEITGSMLIIHAQTEDYKNRSKSGSLSQQCTLRNNDGLVGCGSESEGADVDTDGSNTAAAYSTEAVLAAHALGKDGLQHHTNTPTTGTTTSNSHMEYHALHNSCGDNHSASPGHSYTLPFLSYSTGPVRRKLQKMHEFHTKQRKINVQDIIAVEICKEDKSLGASYVQIELRIHYMKGGNQKRNLQSILSSPLPIVNRDPGNDVVSSTRERLLSASSNCSGSSTVAESIRSNSAESVSATTATLVSTVHTLASAAVSRSTPTSQKQRSTSTGGKAGSGGVVPRSMFDFSPLGNNSSSGSGNSTLLQAAISPSGCAATLGPASTGCLTPSQSGTEKMETVWFKLPLQSNTTTRAAATGKKRRSLAADDGSGGPVLTFELFIATLKRIKESVRVYTVTHGVETIYRVNKVHGEPSPSISLKGVSLLGTPNRSAKSGTAHSPSSTFASPSGSNKLKKNASSGNLCEMSESSLNSTVTVAVPLRLPIALNSPENKSCGSRNMMIPFSTRTISTGSSTSSRTDSSSASPKCNPSTATFSARMSSSSHSHAWGVGGYHSSSGSMNSASGLTSIESLVGIASMRGGARTGSMSAGSASYNTTTTTSTSTSSLSLKNWSPKYEHKFPMDGTLFEETTADIEEMEEETDNSYPDYAHQQSYLNTDDEATVSADEHSHHFLPLTRRHTEGNEELNHNNMRRNHHHLTTSAPICLDENNHSMYKAGESLFMPKEQKHCATAASGCIDENNTVQQEGQPQHPFVAATAECSSNLPTYSEVSIKHSEASIDSSRDDTSDALYRQETDVYSPVLSGRKGHTTEPLPECTTGIELFTELSTTAVTAPTLRRTGSNHSMQSRSSSKADQRRSFDGGSPRSPRSAKTITAATTTTITTNSINQNIKDTTTLLQRIRIEGSGQQLIDQEDQAVVDYLLRHPVKLSKMLEKARNKRTKIELKLVELLTSREKMRECIQYLQSLRAIVDAPPVAPTRSLAKTKAPSIDKAMLLLQVYGDHINLITEGLPPTTSASKHGGRLGDAEEFVRIMLQVNGPTPHTPMPSSSVCDNQLLYSSCERESFTSTAGRGSFTAVHRSSSGPSPLVRKLFTDDMFTRPSATSGTSWAMRPSLDPWNSATEHHNNSASTPQLLRSPPPGFKADFDAVMTHLEEIWNCELESFQHVERLAQCLTQRAQTWQRLKELREQEESMSLPSEEDLYEIAF